MYDELINSLRICGKIRSVYDNCVAFHDGCCEAEPVCMYELMWQAADAIEELSKRVPKAPHGDLIDKKTVTDNLCKILTNAKPHTNYPNWNDAIIAVMTAPTIIPAEEGE